INFWDGLADPSTYEILSAYNADNTHLNDAGHDILFQRVRDANIFAASTLPVKLHSFNASPQQSQVNIRWTITDELPGARYEVQRSSNGTHFKTIHTITSSTSAASRTYNSTDPNAVSGIYYYRLKVTEEARSFYSQVVKLALGKIKLSLKSFSVDASRKELVLKLDATETVRMQLNFINSNGQLVQKNMQLLQPGENRLSFPLNTMPAGTYWAEAISDQQKIFTKGFRVY
ncbi:MAG TPA: hypothetical protein VEB42_00905, partial [Chitinophagaceae bacterium]|nr:hypothetical protein [Chitinophagaceae bacterium]